MAVVTYRDALTQALREELQRDDRVFLMGEEVAQYNGAYKVSKGLLDEFGPMRIVDTPITELGFAGVGVGAAMVGLRPIVEFMTWNFALLAIDEVINAAAKMLYMSGGQYKMPMVFRGPNGAALQLSAQHSQAWESWYAHIPGLKVLTPGTPADAKGLLKSAIRDDNPVVFLEGEMLYNTKGEVPDGEHIVPIGVADVKREGGDCSVVTHGKMVLVAMKIADDLAKEGINPRCRGPPHRSTDRCRSDRALRAEDQSSGCPRGRMGDLRHGLAGRRLHPARVLRRSGRACPSRPPGRRPDAVRQESRASR